MPRPREPIALIEAKGRKHLTKEEIEKRSREELVIDLKDVKAPEYLSNKLTKEFNEIAGKLVKIGIMTELDEDCLARYLLSKQTYLQYTNLLNKATKANNIAEMERLMSIQDKAFKQTQAAARDLGLTIASRCRLVIPTTEETAPANKFDKFRRDA